MKQAINDRIPVLNNTRFKLKEFVANKQYKTFDEGVNALLNKKTVEEKFLETYDFLNEENVSEMVDMVFESNELREIVQSKFEIINKK